MLLPFTAMVLEGVWPWSAPADGLPLVLSTAVATQFATARAPIGSRRRRLENPKRDAPSPRRAPRATAAPSGRGGAAAAAAVAVKPARAR